ncbi:MULTISPECIES: dimethylsulfonioproprionate lyase family protein [unclassified Mesorhizobium]|uniref:dimethylsulfonioproprionate lyase family protein n=1 Tax=unclassified Mesorhizobium TaxID=325217 RepID=UPI001FD1A935|nr:MULTISPECIES: dimethylsulfonioproprionate lyase family protein [unclassified Mesorhizobium]
MVNVADTLCRLNPHLKWQSRNRVGPGASDNFLDGNASAMIVGPGGYEDRDDVWIGASLLGPTVTYPDHTHPPEEAYLVLSSGSFRQSEGDWQRKRAGETFHNRPGILHAMRAEAAPMLALWFLSI